MKRLRFAMLALAIALTIPVALLIALALESVAAEEAAQHQTLASRAFDEMERALSRFLAEEEARPIAHYGYFLDPSESSRPQRSPLSRLSEHPFLIGHFQIDPNGTLYTPLRPRANEPSLNERAPRPTREAIAKLERLVPAALQSARARQGEKKEGEEKASRRPSHFGATIALEEPTTNLARLKLQFGTLLESESLEFSPYSGSLESNESDDDDAAVVELVVARRAESASKLSKGAATAAKSTPLRLDQALESLNVGQKMREQRNKRYAEGVYGEPADASSRDAFRSRQSPRTPLDDARRGAQRSLASTRKAASETASEPASEDRALGQNRQADEVDTSTLAESVQGRLAFRVADGSSLGGDSNRALSRASGEVSGQVSGHDATAADKQERNKLDAGSLVEREASAPPALPQSAADFASPDLAEPRAAAATPARIEIDPMVGHVAGERSLLLSRTVLVGETGYRQGLLIDRLKLGQWLRAQVISNSRLADVSILRFGDEVARHRSARIRGDSYQYRHHFAEPFDSLNATLALRPLEGGASARNIYALSVLLAVVAAGGLFAVYRMIAVMVGFAERRSAFVSAVSHELKTPLTAIRMYGEMLRDGLVQSEEKRHEYYRTIHDESERLGRLINNVLEFSQLERGQRELNMVAGSVDQVVREVVSNLTPHAERQGFTLSADIDDDLPPVRFDRDALVQVLFNLADNAMKYARGAGPQRISIGCHRADERGNRDPEGHRVVLDVRDFGPGVARRHLSHLFEPFYRASSSNDVVRGTGIGLALVRDLCEAMGAAVTAVNLEEGGFRVRVDFRAAEVR